ncbi:MAG: hypothetical protein JJU36_17900 [Phycisphaeraceae bacterium]|nr:hypothetical protein [Phycisphaeraceae bacterium]
MMTRSLSTMGAALLAVGGLIAGASAEVTIPTPATTQHPAGDAVPAASPNTYPDEDGFQRRARIVLEGVADNDLMSWRRGYFTGGDPGKYLPGHAMAKLLIGQDDPNIVRLYNDNRSVNEHYHFAAHNWGRFYPLFGEKILTEEKRREFAASAQRYTAYHSGGGTENHVTQWRMAAAVLPYYLEGDGAIGRRGKDAVLRDMKGWLRNYVKGIYAAGNGEWDSSTYIKFTMNGLMNIYDFAQDEEMRLIARAGLDWFATAYALKYRDGVFTAPQQRGFAEYPHRTISDETGFIWWGSNATITPADTRGWRYSIHPITSGWRPNAVITNIARKNLPDLPAEFRNSKPNYWGTTGSPRPSVMHETLYIGENFNLGSLWNGHGSQISRMSLVVDTDQGGRAFHGGHPRRSDHTGRKLDSINFADGNSRYTQTAQAGAALISMSLSPDDEEHKFSYFRMPLEVNAQQVGDWWLMTAGQVVVAVHPLGGGETRIVEEGEGRRAVKYLRIDGKKSGFILQVLEAPRGDIQRILPQLRRVRVDASRFESDMRVAYTAADGRTIDMTFNPAEGDDRHGNRTPNVTIDGKELTFGDWPVYDGPFVQQKDGVLKVNDGQNGFIIDFTGDLPVYKPWSP